MTCDFPGCFARGIAVPVPSDLPSAVEEEAETFRPSADAPYFVTVYACLDHLELVRRRAQECHQPRHTRLREGRP